MHNFLNHFFCTFLYQKAFSFLLSCPLLTPWFHYFGLISVLSYNILYILPWTLSPLLFPRRFYPKPCFRNLSVLNKWIFSTRPYNRLNNFNSSMTKISCVSCMTWDFVWQAKRVLEHGETLKVFKPQEAEGEQWVLSAVSSFVFLCLIESSDTVSQHERKW